MNTQPKLTEKEQEFFEQLCLLNGNQVQVTYLPYGSIRGLLELPPAIYDEPEEWVVKTEFCGDRVIHLDNILRINVREGVIDVFDTPPSI